MIATAGGLYGRRAPGGRSGIVGLPRTHGDGGTLSNPASYPGPVPSPPDAIGNGGDEGGTTPSIMKPGSVHHEDPEIYAGLFAILVWISCLLYLRPHFWKTGVESSGSGGSFFPATVLGPW